MYAEERQRAIVETVLNADRVAVAELAGRFEVTTEAIRLPGKGTPSPRQGSRW